MQQLKITYIARLHYEKEDDNKISLCWFFNNWASLKDLTRK